MGVLWCSFFVFCCFGGQCVCVCVCVCARVRVFSKFKNTKVILKINHLARVYTTDETKQLGYCARS